MLLRVVHAYTYLKGIDLHVLQFFQVNRRGPGMNGK